VKNSVKVCSILFALIAALALQPLTVIAQQASHPTNKGFSFAVHGDSRSMMYLPYKQDQEAEARQLMVDMFELVLPAKVAPDEWQKMICVETANAADNSLRLGPGGSHKLTASIRLERVGP